MQAYSRFEAQSANVPRLVKPFREAQLDNPLRINTTLLTSSGDANVELVRHLTGEVVHHSKHQFERLSMTEGKVRIYELSWSEKVISALQETEDFVRDVGNGVLVHSAFVSAVPPERVDTDLGDKDIYDTLRELDAALEWLSGYIRKINDPDRKGPAVQMVRAHLDAVRAFLDMEAGQTAPVLPVEVREGLLSRLRKVDWAKFTDTVNKCVQNIIKILEAFR